MSNIHGLQISNKPIPIWNKPLKVNFKELCIALSKAAVDGSFGRWDILAIDVVNASAALGITTDPGEAAWWLIHRSLLQALSNLLEENKKLLSKKPEDNLGALCDQLDLCLENGELVIDQNFFQRPGELPIVKAIQAPCTQWLENLGFTQVQAQSISNRLPIHFTYALHKQWQTHQKDYACLTDALCTPFSPAVEREMAWLHYSALLQKQVEEPMFSEAFSLKQVYVPLRAYFKYKIKVHKHEGLALGSTGNKETERVVVEPESELEAWLNEPKSEPDEAIRIVSGEPGSGKSSFVKMFAAKQAEKGQIRVLFIPLHLLDFNDNLTDAVRDYVRSNTFLPHNPLDRENGEPRLLVIFDGLDELVIKDKAGNETAQQFVREVYRKVSWLNSDKPRLQVLISGREILVQAIKREFRKSRQILYILPYFLTEFERKAEKESYVYVDDKKLLDQDQRQLWWQLYGKATGRAYTGLPPELDKDNLTEITAQPLFNYLLALSFVRNKLNFAEESNLNAIYEDLLEAVYEGGWAAKPRPIVQKFELEEFKRILEEIALACWHDSTLSTTIEDIECQCQNSGLQKLLARFKEEVEDGLACLLTAFYFRQSESKKDMDAFEFTHKSFCEYLTAKRIIQEVRYINKRLKFIPDDLYCSESYKEREALKDWAVVCGLARMSPEIVKFICDEMRLQPSSDISQWQQMLCQLISYMLVCAMPMERLPGRPTFLWETRIALNAEEALLVVLNACARVTKTIAKIEWRSQSAFGIWLSRLFGQRISKDEIPLQCLSFLDLQGCNLLVKDLLFADLEGANLEKAILWETNLRNANLKGANLREAGLDWAILEEAELEGADLEGADLGGANLREANLKGANLREAKLEGANLREANLKGANFEKADLRGANLKGANFEETLLDGANLEGTLLDDEVLASLKVSSDANEPQPLSE